MDFIATWFLIFIIYSFAGWCMEVLISLVLRKKLINRGFLVGPICPIYGVGALLLSAVLDANEPPLVIFCVAFVGSAVLEYLASFVMERLFRVRWWDYTERPFNLNGRICLESILSFGVIGVLMLKLITPALIGLFQSLPPTILILSASIVFVTVLCDIALSLWLILNVRITVGTVERDATDEISHRVQEILMDKGKLNRRLVKAFPNQKPTKKSPSHRKTPKNH